MIFTEIAVFGQATFTEDADFRSAIFKEDADFVFATFTKVVSFWKAIFTEDAEFLSATFKRGVFPEVTFSKAASFNDATFTERADFRDATFLGEVLFQRTHFTEASITFQGSRFSARALFTGSQEDGTQQVAPIFTDTAEVDFRGIVVDAPESFSFRHAIFKKCRLAQHGSPDGADGRTLAPEWVPPGWSMMRNSPSNTEERSRDTPRHMEEGSSAAGDAEGCCTELCTREETGTCTLCESLAEGKSVPLGVDGCLSPTNLLERLPGRIGEIFWRKGLSLGAG